MAKANKKAPKKTNPVVLSEPSSWENDKADWPDEYHEPVSITVSGQSITVSRRINSLRTAQTNFIIGAEKQLSEKYAGRLLSDYSRSAVSLEEVNSFADSLIAQAEQYKKDAKALHGKSVSKSTKSKSVSASPLMQFAQ